MLTLFGLDCVCFLDVREENRGITQKLFRKSTFSYTTLLTMARDMSNAMHYLHTQVYPGATVVHRYVEHLE